MMLLPIFFAVCLAIVAEYYARAIPCVINGKNDKRFVSRESVGG